MKAIPPNRKSTVRDARSRNSSFISMRAMFLLALFLLILGISQRSWSQNAASNGEIVEPNTDEKQTTLHFLAERTQSPTANAAPTKPVPPSGSTPTRAPQLVPPLTIGDYESYIKPAKANAPIANPPAEFKLPSPSIDVKPNRGPAKQLDPISGVEPSQASDKPAHIEHADIAFAPPVQRQDVPSPSIEVKPNRGPAKQLDPISGVEPSQATDKSAHVEHLGDIAFAPPAPRQDDPFVTRLVRPKAVAKPEVPATSTPDTAETSKPAHVEHLADIAFAPSAPRLDDPFVSRLVGTKAVAKPEVPPATTPNIAEIYEPKASTLVETKALASHAPEQQMQELPPEAQPPMPQEDRQPIIADAPKAQAQSTKEPMLVGPPEAPLYTPVAEPRIAEVTKPARPEHYESIATTVPAGPTAPITNSSFLPANPESDCFRCGVQCPPCGCNPGGPGWSAARPIPWEVFAQGEYVGPARLAHVPVYRLRVDDRLSFVYRLSGQVAGQPYRLNVRDRIQIQSLSAPEVVNREVIIQPDGTVTLPLLGQIRAAGTTVEDLGKQLDEQFKRQIKDPRITVTPLVLNSNLDELRASVDRRYGQGGQVSDARVSPDGTVQLPAIGSVPAQGLTLDELEREVKSRYARIVEGLEVTPTLLERAPRFIYVVGEVRVPGRFTMEGPTTLMQAIALAGSWNVGAELEDVVVFRRDDNWQLMATKVNIRSSLLFKKPCPSGEIWLRDSDIVLIPKSKILCADDFIELVFTRGIYGVFPMTASLNFSKLSSL